MARGSSTAQQRGCGCLIGEDGPVVLCRTAERLSRRVDDLIPPYGDDEPHGEAWDTFHRALGEYRRHVGEKAVVS